MNKVIEFLKTQLSKDKAEYKGNLYGFGWNDKSWYIDELYAFIEKDYTRSYTLIHFNRKYTYDELDKILRKNFPNEYEYCMKNLEV